MKSETDSLIKDLRIESDKIKTKIMGITETNKEKWSELMEKAASELLVLWS